MRYRTVLIVASLAVSCGASTIRAAKLAAASTDQRVERTTPADAKVSLSVCLGSGSITVRGWDRNQVRARSSDGMRVDFQRPAGGNSELPKELVLTRDGGPSRMGSNCLTFGDLELDVPREASVDLRAGSAEVKASGIAKLKMTSQGGSIAVEHVTGAVDINTIGGDISLRNSQGSFRVHSVGGSIDIQDIGPGAAGDTCEVSTVGGEITLAQISNQRVRASTVNGTLNFSGPLARGGRYGFSTISGALKLSLPADSSFRLKAVSHNGGISSDFPLKPSSSSTEEAGVLRRRGYDFQSIDAIYGTGDASISLSSFSGSIYLRKK